LEVILWINLILSTIIGGIVGYNFGQLISYRNAGGYAFFGVIIGIICGLLIDIVGGGLIATIINMDTNLEKLTKRNLSPDSNDESINEKKELKTENKIIINNNDVDNTGKIKIIVERVNNKICSAMPLEIFIDKKKAFLIENASKVIDFVDNGSHSIYASLDYNTQSEVVNFDTDNPEIKFKLSVLGVGKIKLEKMV